MARARDFFRTPVYPFLADWSGGPALVFSLVRFFVWVGWPTGLQEESSQQTQTTDLAVLAPELPLSVIPASFRSRLNLRVGPASDEQWRRVPNPRWRGVICDLGV